MCVVCAQLSSFFTLLLQPACPSDTHTQHTHNTRSYHRLLTHRSFKTSKAFEYFLAWMGAQGGQGEPIEWVSTHRHHHLHTDTPLDPHSPYEGFWWSHITWLANTEYSTADYSNAKDLQSQLFYRVLEVVFFPWLFIAKPLLTYHYLGGLAAVTWTLAVPMVLGWHSTFLVNSAAHVWGRRPYDTGDLSTNNWVSLFFRWWRKNSGTCCCCCWVSCLSTRAPPPPLTPPLPLSSYHHHQKNKQWVSIVSFGEGWHNSHHAFPYSARHGLEWWEIDMTWYLICALEALGIVWDVQVPSEKVREARRRKDAAKKAE